MAEGIEQAIEIPFRQIDGVEVCLPPISVIIQCYNQGRFIGDAIRSVARQTYSEFECVIVDDCSTDDSASLICAALDDIQDSRFRFIRRERNGGQMATMFTGFDAGDAPFVAFMDGDDVWLPSFLETHISAHLNSEVNAAFSSCNLATIDAKNTLLSGANLALTSGSPGRNHGRKFELNIPSIRQIAEERPHPKTVIFVKYHYYPWLWSPTSGLVFRRAVLDAIRPENLGDFRVSADVYLARFAQVIGGSIIMHEAHGYYRLHGANNGSFRAVYGDGVAFCCTPEEIEEATRRTMLEKLCKDQLFAEIMEDFPRIEAAMRLAISLEDYRMIYRSVSNRKGCPRKLKKKMRSEFRRAIKNRLFKALAPVFWPQKQKAHPA